MVGYGTQLHVLQEVADMAQEQMQVSCEIIDLQTILPWDEQTVYEVCAFVLLLYRYGIQPRQSKERRWGGVSCTHALKKLQTYANMVRLMLW